MVKQCAVEGCKSGTRKDMTRRKATGLAPVSFFSIPKRSNALQAWSSALRQKLLATNFICEQHFSDDSIVRIDTTVLRDGTLHQLAREKPKLIANAIPMSPADKDKNVHVVENNATDDWVTFAVDASNDSEKENHERSRQARNDEMNDFPPIPEVSTSITRPLTAAEVSNQSTRSTGSLIIRNLADTAPQQTIVLDRPVQPIREPADADLPLQADVEMDVPGFADHLLETSAESSVDIQTDAHREWDADSPMPFTIDDVLNSLKGLTLLPENWCWSRNRRSERSIVFIRFDALTQSPTLRVVLYNDLSISIQTADQKVGLQSDAIITSVSALEQLLNDTSKKVICGGTGLNEESRDQSCLGFVPSDVYKKHVLTPRCSFCRRLRIRIQNQSRRRKVDVKTRYARTKHRSNVKQRACKRLRQKAVAQSRGNKKLKHASDVSTTSRK